MRNKILIFISLIFLISCSANKISKFKFNDGIYETSLGEKKPISYFYLKIEIKDDKIIKSKVVFRDPENSIKKENYNIVEESLETMSKYSKKLLEVQNPEKIDAISGASISHKIFNKASHKILEKAKK